MRSALCVVAMVCAILPSQLAAQSDRPSRPGRAWRVSLAGDLDAMALATRLDEVLAQAHQRNASLVLLELAGNRWRPDVVWAMAQVIEQSDTPVVALLQDTRDHRVGAGQLMLATLCESSWIDPDTQILSTQDDDLSLYAPSTTDWERVERELAGAIWVRLYERDGPVLLARPLVDQRDAVWIELEGKPTADAQTDDDKPDANLDEAAPVPAQPLIITRGPQHSDNAQPIVTVSENGSFTIAITPGRAIRLGLVLGIERRPAVVLRQAGARPVSPHKVTLESGLDKAHERAWVLLEQLDAVLDDLERLPGSDRSTDQRDRRDIDAQLRQGMQHFQEGRSQLGQLLAIYPEILAMPAPTNITRNFAQTLDNLDNRYDRLDNGRSLTR
jgi:hypothetical protein